MELRNQSFPQTITIGTYTQQRQDDLYKTLGCAVCQQNNVEETWDHFLPCPGLATQ